MSSMPNLDGLCAFDGRPIGDHTMREWAAHLDAGPHTDLAFEVIPDGPVMMNVTDGDEPLPVADSIVARAAVFDGRAGAAVVKVPLLLLDLQIGVPGAAPRTFYRFGIISSPDVMRKIGTLLRDSAFGAATAAERAQR